LAGLTYSRRSLEALERLTDFLLESDPTAALETIDLGESRAENRDHPAIANEDGPDFPTD